ncbi:MAG: replication factor C large subunit [Methanomicrobiales archaeon]|nr:replication factor C large subunit [Methanomicrobiales archaeon]
MDWTEKYRPSHLADIVGNGTAVHQMLDWARGWKRGTKPLILYGKPGIGKTSAAYALANDMQWEAMELNASDTRTKAIIERVAGAGSTSGSLTGAARRLVVLDEADNLQGTADKGGAKAILDIIRDARQPIILIANDLYGLASDLRAACDPVQFKALPARSLIPHLKYICSVEKVQCNDQALKDIADNSAGDMRAAVTTLYAASIGKQRIEEPDIRTSMKDGRASIFQLIPAVFGRCAGAELVRMSYEVDDKPDAIEQWIEANLASLKGPEATAQAYRYLSRADEYIGNTNRRQYFMLWRYATVTMLLGTNVASGGHGIHERISSPRRWQRMASSKRQKGIRTALLGKLGGLIHMPQQTVRDGYLNLLSILAEKDPLFFARELDLDADQLGLLIHDRAKAITIAKALAVERREEDKREKIKAQKKTAPEQKIKPAPAVTPARVKAGVLETVLPDEPGSPPPPQQEKQQKAGGRQSTLF